MAILYVITKCNNPRYAFEEESLVHVISVGPSGGPDPFGDAKSYAIDSTRADDRPTYIFRVELTLKGSMEVTKEVNYRPAQP
jgi:hypothetical protein